MNSVQTTASTPRQNRVLSTILIVVSAAVLAAGISYFTYDKVSGSSSSAKSVAPVAKQPTPALKQGSTPTKPKPVHVSYSHLNPQIHAAVRTFVMSAAGRKNPGASWSITAPSLRQGFSKKAWATGTIPVEFYPVDHIIPGTFKVIGYTPREVTLLMGLAPTPRARIHPLTYEIGLHKFGSGAHARWLVDYWNARWSPGIPYAAQ
jgi:hypothetical protein